jgi:small subunit ribosomal protein S6
MRKYEVMLILPADADDAVVQGAVDRVSQVLARSSGTLGEVDRWGKRRLAYEIARNTEGYYVVVAFEAEPTSVAELERVLKLADEVIRHKVVLRAA